MKRYSNNGLRPVLANLIRATRRANRTLLKLRMDRLTNQYAIPTRYAVGTKGAA